MGKPVAVGLLTLLLLASPGPFLASAWTDMVPPPAPGTHRQIHVSTLDLGMWADYTVRFARIEEGDTIGGIAREHLGSTKRWNEIAKLNLVDAHAFSFGGVILLPPLHEPLPPGVKSDPGRPDAREWWDFYVLSNVSGKLDRHRTDPSGAPLGTGMLLVAIRHDKTAKVLKQVDADPAGAREVLDALAPTSSEWLARSDALPESRRVKDADPAHKVVMHWRVSDIQDGRIELENVSLRRFGEDEQVLPPRSQSPAADLDADAGANADPNDRRSVLGWDLILVFLGLLVVVGVAVILVQRGRGESPGPASSA